MVSEALRDGLFLLNLPLIAFLLIVVDIDELGQAYMMDITAR
jgi:hypothetical protein